MDVQTIKLLHCIGATEDQMSAKISGTQTLEYKKLCANFDAVIHYLSAILSAEELADKLFVNKLITSGLREEASLGTITNTKKIRTLIVAVLAQVEIEPVKYNKFLALLSCISGTEDIAKLLTL